MPLGIGKYSEHVKIATDSFEDDQAAESYAPSPVRFIGQQKLPMFNIKEISGIIHEVYNKNYSPLNSLIHVKKYLLMVDALGINVLNHTSKKCHNPDIYMKYPLQDMIFVTGDYQYERLFAVVYHGPLRNCLLHLYLCANEDDVKDILNRCCEVFPSKVIKKIEKSLYTDGYEIIHYKAHEKLKMDMEESSTSIGELLRKKDIKLSEKDVKLLDKYESFPTKYCDKYNSATVKQCDEDRKIEKNSTIFKAENNLLTDNSIDSCNFGEFQSASVTNSVTPIPESPVEKTDGKIKLMDEDDLEDEFSQLALKRNIYLPDHLQDKSIESTLLYPDVDYVQNQDQVRPSLFSSYTKLQ